ncbi:MAG: multidrug efflux SMR transporter [Sphingomonadales bacterium]|nr:multidrug efflux SMR transporter [Sphingomonadales bacterium]
MAPPAWLYLAIAIVSEIIATSALKESDGLRRLVPAAVALLGYLVAFTCLARALRTIPLGVAYAVWSGVGIASLALIGAVVYRQALSPVQGFGIGAIMVGVIALSAAR